jgi:hypothetical protein
MCKVATSSPTSGLERGGSEAAGGGDASDLERQELVRIREKGEEAEGDSRAGSPWTRADGKVAVGGTLGRRARSHGGGGAPALRR